MHYYNNLLQCHFPVFEAMATDEELDTLECLGNLSYMQMEMAFLKFDSIILKGMLREVLHHVYCGVKDQSDIDDLEDFDPYLYTERLKNFISIYFTVHTAEEASTFKSPSMLLHLHDCSKCSS